jgi:hypothetical protein
MQPPVPPDRADLRAEPDRADLRAEPDHADVRLGAPGPLKEASEG